MAGQITVSTLRDDTGVLATQNGMTGIAKAWVNYNGSTQTINQSFNVSSVTRSGAGGYAINFTTALSNANPCSVATVNAPAGQNLGAVNINTISASSVTALVTGISGSSNTNVDAAIVSVAVFSTT
jgi:hypothetical protein